MRNSPDSSVFEEDEAEDDMLVFRGIHVPAHLVGGSPELGFEIEAGVVIFSVGRLASHVLCGL